MNDQLFTGELAKCQTLLQETFLIIIWPDELERWKKHPQIKFSHLYADEDRLYNIEKGTEKKWTKFDMHFLVMGLKPNDELRSKLIDFKVELYGIGDARKPRKGVDAIREGAEIGNSI